MILGIGIDIVEVERLRKHQHNDGFLKRILHPDEYLYIRQTGGDPYMLAAARFAAKEAFGKALGTGLKRMRLSEIRVAHDRNHKPFLELEGKAAEKLKSIGGKRVHLSLSHEQHYASAIVIIED